MCLATFDFVAPGPLAYSFLYHLFFRKGGAGPFCFLLFDPKSGVFFEGLMLSAILVKGSSLLLREFK